MQLSRDSLFVRFLRTNFVTADWYVSYNLCPFMRRVAAGIVINTFLAFCAGLLLLANIFGIIAMFIPSDLWGEAWSVCVGIIIAELLIATAFGTGLGINKLAKRYHPVGKLLTKIEGSDSMRATGAWVQAKHDKICPEITYGD